MSCLVAGLENLPFLSGAELSKPLNNTSRLMPHSIILLVSSLHAHNILLQLYSFTFCDLALIQGKSVFVRPRSCLENLQAL